MVNIDSKNNIDGKKKNWFISDKNIDWFLFLEIIIYTQGVGECRITAARQRMH